MCRWVKVSGYPALHQGSGGWRKRWRKLAGRTSSTAPIRPEAPSETTSSGARSPRVTILPNDPHPDVGGLVGSSVDIDQRRAALGADPHAARTRSDRAPSCIRKWLPSKNRYSSATSGRSTLGDTPRRPAAEKQPVVGAPQLRRVDRHRPGSGLDRGRTVPVTAPGPSPGAVPVAMPARNSVTSASIAICIDRHTPSRAKPSDTSANSRSEPNKSSISARTRSIGDTRRDTGVGSLLCLQGITACKASRETYARRPFTPRTGRHIADERPAEAGVSPKGRANVFSDATSGSRPEAGPEVWRRFAASST